MNDTTELDELKDTGRVTRRAREAEQGALNDLIDQRAKYEAMRDTLDANILDLNVAIYAAQRKLTALPPVIRGVPAAAPDRAAIGIAAKPGKGKTGGTEPPVQKQIVAGQGVETDPPADDDRTEPPELPDSVETEIANALSAQN